MEYVIPVILVLLLVAGFVTFLVLNATKKSGRAGPSDPGAEGNPAGIMAPDDAPLGDTEEHAGEQREGQTVGGQDGAGVTRGGSGGITDGGEGEGGSRQASEPESERLSNRPR